MSYDAVTIANLALSHCGAQQFITSLDDTTQEAALCNLHYEPCRDAVLGVLHWPFAKRYVALALVEEGVAQDWSSEWAYVYRYPTDCTRVRRVLTGSRRDPNAVPFELGSDATGRLIYCDSEDALIAYTHRVTDVTIYPDQFCEAVAWKMASRMALPLSARADLAQAAEKQYQMALADAKILALTEERRDVQPDAEWIRARG